MYVCALCGRSMNKPAATVAGRVFGPKCARRAGLLTREGMSLAQIKVEKDDLTIDMFEEAEK